MVLSKVTRHHFTRFHGHSGQSYNAIALWLNRIQTNSSADCSRHKIFRIVDIYSVDDTTLMLYKGERCVICRRRRHSLFCDTKNLPLCNVAPLIIINQQPPSTSHPMKYVTRDYQKLDTWLLLLQSWEPHYNRLVYTILCFAIQYLAPSVTVVLVYTRWVASSA